MKLACGCVVVLVGVLVLVMIAGVLMEETTLPPQSTQSSPNTPSVKSREQQSVAVDEQSPQQATSSSRSETRVGLEYPDISTLELTMSKDSIPHDTFVAARDWLDRMDRAKKTRADVAVQRMSVTGTDGQKELEALHAYFEGISKLLGRGAFAENALRIAQGKIAATLGRIAGLKKKKPSPESVKQYDTTIAAAKGTQKKIEEQIQRMEIMDKALKNDTQHIHDLVEYFSFSQNTVGQETAKRHARESLSELMAGQ